MKFNELHEKLFDMWLMFDSICQKYDITYYFDSGSAIGAVREHDFIPWDDDIDVAIMREDYIKLKNVLKIELPEEYKLVEPKEFSPYFLDMIPKLINLNVPLRKETDIDKAYKNYQNRMAIDFFILDNVPDNKILQKFIVFKQKMYYGFLRSKRFSKSTMKMSLIEKVMCGGLQIIGNFFSLEQLLKYYNHNILKYKNIKSSSVIRSNGILHSGCYDKSLYADVVMMDFHGGKAPVPIGYDNILTRMYGDYMTPVKGYKGFFVHADIDE